MRIESQTYGSQTYGSPTYGSDLRVLDLRVRPTGLGAAAGESYGSARAGKALTISLQRPASLTLKVLDVELLALQLQASSLLCNAMPASESYDSEEEEVPGEEAAALAEDKRSHTNLKEKATPGEGLTWTAAARDAAVAVRGRRRSPALIDVEPVAEGNGKGKGRLEPKVRGGSPAPRRLTRRCQRSGRSSWVREVGVEARRRAVQ